MTSLSLPTETQCPPLMIEAIRAFNDNYLWLISHTERKTAYIVDPGDAKPVKEALAERGLTLSGILITHHHMDHTGGIAALLESYEVPVYGPHNPAIPTITHPLKEGDTVDLEPIQCQFTVFEVPGHTLDHIAYFADRDQSPHQKPILFCGDTLFSAGCGRLFEGTPEQMLQSLTRLSQLPTNTLVYCTHEYTLANLAFAAAVEPENSAIQTVTEECEALREKDKITLPTTLEREFAINPFLRSAESGVIQAAMQYKEGMSKSPSTAEVFTAIREWKNNF